MMQPRKHNGYRPLTDPHQPLTDANQHIDPSWHSARFFSMYSDYLPENAPAVRDAGTYAVAIMCGIAGLLYLTS